MLGSIQKKGKQYYIVFDEGRDPVTGVRKQRWLPAGNDKPAAEAKYAAMAKDIHEGDYMEPSDTPLKEYLDKWLEHIEGEVRASTYTSYQWAAKALASSKLGQIPIDKLRPMHVQNFLTAARKAPVKSLVKPKRPLTRNFRVPRPEKEKKAEKPARLLSATSVRYQYSVLKAALTQAVKWQLLIVNPCVAIDPPRAEKFKASVFNPEQLQTLLDGVENTFLRLPVTVAVTCGLRRGEVCALRWDDFITDTNVLYVRNSLDWKNGELTIQPVKTDQSERSVKLPELAVTALKAEKVRQAVHKLKAGEHYQQKKYIWAREDGRPYDPDFLYKHFLKLLATIGLPRIRFHDLRHSHATCLLLAGVPTKIVSERLGHSSTNFTEDIYSHILPQMQEHAANEVDRLLTRKPAVIPEADKVKTSDT